MIMEKKDVTKEMYEALKAPLPEGAVTKHPTKTYLSSIKAIYVTERLNDVFGCGSWQIRAEKISENEKGMVVIKTTLTIPDYGIYYECFGGNDNGGEENKNFDLGDAYKGATTDGITKIGSYMGIGISVFKGKGNVAEVTELTYKQNSPDQKLHKRGDYENKIKDSTSLEELQKVWESIPTEWKIEYEGIKNLQKNLLK
jgi:hypothetical protein